MSKIKINGDVDLYYEKLGSGKPILVFIHGWTANSWVWKFQKEYFSKEYQVVLLDLKGHGKSDKPDGKYDIPEYTEDIYNALNKLYPDDKFVLFGHSMGGMIALYFATHPVYSKKLIGLVLMSTISRKLTSAKLLLNDLQSGKISIEDPIIIEEIAKSGYYGKFIRKNKDVLKLNIEEAQKCPGDIALKSLEYFVNEYDVSDKLKNIVVPTLILAGDKDVQINNEESELMLKKIKNSKLEIIGPGVGHMLQYEKPDLVNKTIEEFLTNSISQSTS
jgi:pimeloyl-ACP methyl ester carboxylesterase